MALKTGLAGQLGIADESTYGTYVAPTKFYEIESESMAPDLVHLEGRGLRKRFVQTGRAPTVIRGAAGSFSLPVLTNGFGLLLKQLMGTYANSVVSGTERRHRIEIAGADDTIGKFTLQVGRPAIDGTVHPFNFEGGKVTGFELRQDLDDILKLTVDVDAETVQTSSALEAASYASGATPFHFGQLAVTLNGSAVTTRGLGIRVNNGLITDRRFVGNSKKEPVVGAPASVEITLDPEFEALADFTGLLAGTEVANLIATWDTGTAIAGGAGNYKLQATAFLVKRTAANAPVGNLGIVRNPITLMALDDGTNPPLRIDLHNLETA